MLSLLTDWYLQFYQPMVINSLAASLIPVAVVMLQSQQGTSRKGGVVRNLLRAVLQIAVAMLATSIINMGVKVRVMLAFG